VISGDHVSLYLATGKFNCKHADEKGLREFDDLQYAMTRNCHKINWSKNVFFHPTVCDLRIHRQIASQFAQRRFLEEKRDFICKFRFKPDNLKLF